MRSYHNKRSSIGRPCLYCGKWFYPWHSGLAQGGGKYCTHPCALNASPPPKIEKPLAGRLWPRIDKNGPVFRDLGPCWVWTGGRFGTGYGEISAHGKTQGVHCIVYELLIGPIPDGLELDHLCRNKICCNPAHLDPVSHLENILRGEHPIGKVFRSGRCSKGHEMTGSNIYMWRDKRYCQVCRREYKREQARRKREQLAG